MPHNPTTDIFQVGSGVNIESSAGLHEGEQDGCCLAGVSIELMAFYWNASLNARHFLIQGVLGGFTTFSAFAIEFGGLYGRGSHHLAFLYATLSVVLSLGAFFCGVRLTKLFVF